MSTRNELAYLFAAFGFETPISANIIRELGVESLADFSDVTRDQISEVSEKLDLKAVQYTRLLNLYKHAIQPYRNDVRVDLYYIVNISESHRIMRIAQMILFSASGTRRNRSALHFAAQVQPR